MRNFRTAWGVIGAAILAGAAAPTARAWDCAGHRMITLLALDALPNNAPEFLRDEETRQMVAAQACEPDRWRTAASDVMKHENEPDHFLDVEDLELFGMTLDSMPRLRYDYVAALTLGLRAEPGRVWVVDEEGDRAHVHVWPGFVPYAVMEHYVKLRSSVRTLRTLEKLNDPGRTPQMQLARANVVCEMGLLSHFVGDIAQPLHTSKHFNGWKGKNPKGYTTNKSFHAKIDGGLISAHKISYESMRAEPGALALPGVDARDPWDQVIAHIRRSFEKVEPLYELERRHALEMPEGKAFLEERLRDAAGMLGALYVAAFEQPKPSAKDVKDLVKYDKPAAAPPVVVAPPAQPPPAAAPMPEPAPALPPESAPESAPELPEAIAPGGGG